MSSAATRGTVRFYELKPSQRVAGSSPPISKSMPSSNSDISHSGHICFIGTCLQLCRGAYFKEMYETGSLYDKYDAVPKQELS